MEASKIIENKNIYCDYTSSTYGRVTNRIIVMYQGRIEEEGTHSQLLKNKDYIISYFIFSKRVLSGIFNS